jgi:hypothetical protein
MNTVLLIARLLLALVFMLAGVAKLADRKGSKQAVIDFGVPIALAAPLGVLLPLAELAVACLPLLPGGALWGRSHPSRCSSLASPSTWLAAGRQSATASVSCTPPRLVGTHSHATAFSLPWLAKFCGRVTMEPDPARSPGSESSRWPSCWASSAGFSCSPSWPGSGGSWCTSGRMGGFWYALRLWREPLPGLPQAVARRHPKTAPPSTKKQRDYHAHCGAGGR